MRCGRWSVKCLFWPLGDSARWLQGSAPRRDGQADRFPWPPRAATAKPPCSMNTIEFLEGNENGSILQEEG